jgi:hypothetical protein
LRASFCPNSLLTADRSIELHLQPSQEFQGSILHWRASQGLAAVRDFNPADVGLGAAQRKRHAFAF